MSAASPCDAAHPNILFNGHIYRLSSDAYSCPQEINGSHTIFVFSCIKHQLRQLSDISPVWHKVVQWSKGDSRRLHKHQLSHLHCRSHAAAGGDDKRQLQFKSLICHVWYCHCFGLCGRRRIYLYFFYCFKCLFFHCSCTLQVLRKFRDLDTRQSLLSMLCCC